MTMALIVLLMLNPSLTGWASSDPVMSLFHRPCSAAHVADLSWVVWQAKRRSPLRLNQLTFRVAYCHWLQRPLQLQTELLPLVVKRGVVPLLALILPSAQ